MALVVMANIDFSQMIPLVPYLKKELVLLSPTDLLMELDKAMQLNNILLINPVPVAHEAAPGAQVNQASALGN